MRIYNSFRIDRKLAHPTGHPTVWNVFYYGKYFVPDHFLSKKLVRTVLSSSILVIKCQDLTKKWKSTSWSQASAPDGPPHCLKSVSLWKALCSRPLPVKKVGADGGISLDFLDYVSDFDQKMRFYNCFGIDRKLPHPTGHHTARKVFHYGKYFVPNHFLSKKLVRAAVSSSIFVIKCQTLIKIWKSTSWSQASATDGPPHCLKSVSLWKVLCSWPLPVKKLGRTVVPYSILGTNS